MDAGAWIILGVNVAWIVPFVYFMVKQAKKAGASRAHRKQLLDTGVPARAEILVVDEVGPSYSGTPHLQFRVRVQAETPRGTSFEATAIGFFQRIQYPQLQPGMQVDVKLDPNDLTQVAIVGDRLV